ncbi:MAG: hypothetical protein JWM11_6622 [Planctomycetaceae bacterium]|nr:hypothetical protein [Planctomycetaceae bacterium]
MSFTMQMIPMNLCLCFSLVSVSLSAEPRRLTQDGRQKSSPVFRESGKELVFVEFSDAKLFQLRRLVLADRKNELLHPDATFAEFEPTWSADGERSACLKLRGVLSISIILRDSKGTLLGEIMPGAGFNGFRSPALAPRSFPSGVFLRRTRHSADFLLAIKR